MPRVTSYASAVLSGMVGVKDTFPDKSLSHRCVIISAISEGVSVVSNLLEGEDVLHTIKALELAGVKILKEKEQWVIYGGGLNSLTEPRSHLYLGNSGTSTRLLAGLFAPYNFHTFFTGDDSLSKRPMQRIFKPLEQMGAHFFATSEFTPPFCMKGSENLMPIDWEMELPSAQVKSAVLLAACQIQGTTTIIENIPTRNHTENMLESFGAEITVKNNSITIAGGKQLVAQEVTVPNDPSSAAFIVAVAVLCNGSCITVSNVCVNKTRSGFFEALKQMNANIELKNLRVINGEEIADISVMFSPNLKPIHLHERIAPSMIDEYPILFVLSAFIDGTSTFHGLKELTKKESNRLKNMEENLRKMGVKCKVNYEDYSMEITGQKDFIVNSSDVIQTYMDHRIAMACFVAGLRGKVTIDDDSYIKTSFPNFLKIMKQIGCNFD